MTENNTFNLGEKIETIIASRKSGKFGGFIQIDSTKYFASCVVDDVPYGIERNVEVDSEWYWKVTNINTGKTITLKDKWDLSVLKISDFIGD